MHTFDKEPTLKEFATSFNKLVDEIGVNSNEEGWIGSHKIVGGVSVFCDNADDDDAYEIVGLDIGQLGGCGCWSDVHIIIRKVK